MPKAGSDEHGTHEATLPREGHSGPRVEVRLQEPDAGAQDREDRLTAITGQKPLVTKSKKSISNFKVREGMSIGACVTLRGDRMYEFFDRLVNVALPRVRDFRGVANKLSGRGDYTLGLKEQFIFPEIDFDKVERVQGMNVTVVTTAKSDEEGRELLRLMGMPFRN
jgi:large subunit ribosomal protein L5